MSILDEMTDTYIIECLYTVGAGHHWEPIPDGTFASEAEAIAGMTELENELGWRGLRVVRETADGKRTVVECGRPRNHETEE